MKIELADIQYAKFASHQTPCFTANVVIDGVKAGAVGNDGHGGGHRYTPWTLYEHINEHTKTMQRVVTDLDDERTGGKFSFQPTPDHLVSLLLDDYLSRAEYKKTLSKRLVWARSGEVYTSKQKMKPARLRAALDDPNLRAKTGADEILNLMPLDEGYALWRKAQP